MAEILDNEPLSASSESPIISDCKDDDEPSPKKRETTVDTEQFDKLEHRLGSILCCVICLDLPQAAVYQCSNGHLMCESCFTHLLVDARLRYDNATCPSCQADGVSLRVRGLRVARSGARGGDARGGLRAPAPRRRGPAAAAGASRAEPRRVPRAPHAAARPAVLREDHLQRPAAAAVSHRGAAQAVLRDVALHGLRAPVGRQGFRQRAPARSHAERAARDYLILKSKPSSALCVRWVATRGPGGAAELRPCLAAHAFLDDEAAPPRAMPLADPGDADRLLAAKAVHFRLIINCHYQLF